MAGSAARSSAPLMSPGLAGGSEKVPVIGHVFPRRVSERPKFPPLDGLELSSRLTPRFLLKPSSAVSHRSACQTPSMRIGVPFRISQQRLPIDDMTYRPH